NLWDIKNPISCSLDTQSSNILKSKNIKITPFRMTRINEFMVDIKTSYNITKYNEIAKHCRIVKKELISESFLKIIEFIKNDFTKEEEGERIIESKSLQIIKNNIKNSDNIYIIWRVLNIKDSEKAIESLKNQTDKNFNCLFVTNNLDINNYILENGFNAMYNDLSHLTELQPISLLGVTRDPYPSNDLYNIALKDSDAKRYWILDSGMSIPENAIENINSNLVDGNILFQIIYNGNIHPSTCAFVFTDKKDINFLPYIGGGTMVCNNLYEQPHTKIDIIIASCD
ncbi:MAG: hypothetical protein WCT77_11835, partial [Bacteroidota bacterium]